MAWKLSKRVNFRRGSLIMHENFFLFSVHVHYRQSSRFKVPRISTWIKKCLAFSHRVRSVWKKPPRSSMIGSWSSPEWCTERTRRGTVILPTCWLSQQLLFKTWSKNFQTHREKVQHISVLFYWYENFLTNQQHLMNTTFPKSHITSIIWICFILNFDITLKLLPPNNFASSFCRRCIQSSHWNVGHPPFTLMVDLV